MSDWRREQIGVGVERCPLDHELAVALRTDPVDPLTPNQVRAAFGFPPLAPEGFPLPERLTGLQRLLRRAFCRR